MGGSVFVDELGDFDVEAAILAAAIRLQMENHPLGVLERVCPKVEAAEGQYGV